MKKWEWPKNPFEARDHEISKKMEKPTKNITKNQSTALQDDLDEDTSPEMKEFIATIKDSGKELFIVYRCNDVYDNLVPSITKTLTKHQIPFSCQAFPQWTDKQEIKKRVEEHRDEYIGKVFVSDFTCSYDRDYKNKERNSFGDCNLDFICGGSVEKFYKEKFSTELEYKIEWFDRVFTDLLRQCLIHEQPEKIIILKPGISDHGTSEALACEPSEDMHDLYENNRSRYNALQDQMRTAIVHKLQEFVKDTGYAWEIVISDGNDNYAMDSEKNRFIYDRHMTWYNKSAHQPQKAKSLVLPFSNLLSQMKKYDFFTDIPSNDDIKKYVFDNIAGIITQK